MAIKLFTSGKMREMDERTVREAGVSTLILMEHAALESARHAWKMVRDSAGKKIVVACGPGNNGGDGLAAARILRDWGAEADVFLAADPETLRGDPRANFGILRKLDIPVLNPISHGSDFKKSLSECDCVLDALFGTGLKRNIEGEIARIIRAINESGKPVVSVDLPSGIDGDTGKILGVAVRARITVALGAAKLGLYIYPGREYAGEIKTVYIGIPGGILNAAPAGALLIEKEDVRKWLPVWKPDAHKGTRGKVMIIGGSRGYSGAPALSGMAAQESGSGLTYVAVPDGIRNLMEHKLTDAVKVGFPQTKDWVLGKISLPDTKEWFGKMDALAVGPGIGRHPDTTEFVRTVVQEYQGPMVIDADGLYHLDEPFLRKLGRPSIVLTPHEGEMAALCGISPEEVRENRLELARSKAETWKVTIVLKGASTLIASGNSLWINPTGNPGLAVGGSGDVLTGLLGSLLAQAMEPVQAACSASFIHGLAGDLCANEYGARGVTASKIVGTLYQAFRSVDLSDG